MLTLEVLRLYRTQNPVKYLAKFGHKTPEQVMDERSGKPAPVEYETNAKIEEKKELEAQFETNEAAPVEKPKRVKNVKNVETK